jgi:hypothetical protein
MVWRKKVRKCRECGKEFIANSPGHWWCHNPCVSPNRRFYISRYYHIVGIRYLYEKMKKRNPALAKKVKEEMVEEEGEEFTEMVLDGM